MQLSIVRHGHAVFQTEQDGFTPDGWLSAQGERQAALLARRLAADTAITHLLSSPLLRALGTASIIAEGLGGKSIEVWADLREGFDQPHRGHGRAALLARFPLALLPGEVTREGWDHGGDTYASFFARCAGVVRALTGRFGREDRVVVVTHGGCANYMQHAILGIPPASPQWFELDYCSLSEVRFVPEAERRTGFRLYPAVEAEVLRLNDVAHLTAEVQKL